MARSDLDAQARAFATQLQNLLNCTIADNARVVSLSVGPKLAAVGTNLDRDLKTSPIPLRSTSKQHRCWLDIQIQLFLPDQYLTVQQSYFGILANPMDDNPLFHYDYERGKDAYTEAHLQVFGNNERLDPTVGGQEAAREAALVRLITAFWVTTPAWNTGRIACSSRTHSWHVHTEPEVSAHGLPHSVSPPRPGRGSRMCSTAITTGAVRVRAPTHPDTRCTRRPPPDRHRRSATADRTLSTRRPTRCSSGLRP